MTPELSKEVFDRAAALSSAGGDPDFLIDLVGLFQAAWPTLRNDIELGLASADLRSVEQGARLAKVASQNIYALRVSESAARLVVGAREGSLAAAEAAFATLEFEVKRLIPHLIDFRNSQTFKQA